MTAKALLREEGKERQQELKALELKGETTENSVLLESGGLATTMYILYTFSKWSVHSAMPWHPS